MKRLLILISCLVLSFGLMAQERAGTISGTVTDNQGTRSPASA